MGVFAIIVASTALSPTVSPAIPVAGDYEFTNGLVGTFTSDGQHLTEWDFQVAGSTVTWTPSNSIQTVTSNNSDAFSALQPGLTPLLSSSISLVWNDPSGSPRYVSTDPKGANTELLLYRPASAIPEPSSLVLLFVGVGLLAYNGWRQRNQAGL